MTDDVQNEALTQIVRVNIEDEMQASYLDYAMSVIIGRALPDVRDGLKPVHRRVLFAMHELGNGYNRAYKKSARVVGDVIGKFHPHGDQAVYDTLVRMAQDFSMRHVLVDGQGNFGSVDGDPPAAMRYTEVRMARIASELLADIQKDTVDFVGNYDESLQEPVVLPTRIPNLIINGSSGIAVGMATNIPPHNLGEVIDATIALASDPHLSVSDLMKFVPGPDFPTAGIVYGTSGIRRAFETGRGIIRMRGRINIETAKKDRERIIITEIPYQVNKASLIEKIADLVREKRIEGISDLRDESDRQGMRVVIELKRDANAEVIVNQLYTMTPLQSSFGYNMLAIVEGRPTTLSLKEILQHFLNHRRDVISRRSRFDLSEARKRFNVVFGLLAAIDSIDRIIAIIRAAKDQDEARDNMMQQDLTIGPAFRALCNEVLTFEFEQGKEALGRGHVTLNRAQAQAILDMRLARLTGLERDKLEAETRELRQTIEELLAILGSDVRLTEVIIQELREARSIFANPRRTELITDTREMSAEDLIDDEDVVVTISHLGYIKRVPMGEYASQNRGGRGKTGTTTRDEDFVVDMFVASTHDYVLIFTDHGKVYWLKIYQLPEGSRIARGKPIVNLLPLEKDEKISTVLSIRNFTEGNYLVMATANGYIKKTDLMAFANPRSNGLIALTLDEGDRLINVGLTDGTQDILIATTFGQAIRFPEEQVRPMGRTARGVRSITLKKESDHVVAMVIVRPEEQLLTATTNGLAKRTSFDEYRPQGRGGSGIINCKLVGDAHVAGVVGVRDDDHVMVVTNRGMMMRTQVSQISTIGRASQGVRLMSVGENEEVCSVARIADVPAAPGTQDTPASDALVDTLTPVI